MFIFCLCRKDKMHKHYSQLLRNTDNLHIWIMCHSHYMCVCSYGPCCNNLREHYWISTGFLVNTNFRNLSYWHGIKAADPKLSSPWSTSMTKPYIDHLKSFFFILPLNLWTILPAQNVVYYITYPLRWTAFTEGTLRIIHIKFYLLTFMFVCITAYHDFTAVIQLFSLTAA